MYSRLMRFNHVFFKREICCIFVRSELRDRTYSLVEKRNVHAERIADKQFAWGLGLLLNCRDASARSLID